jgi:CSLREA domain-containing protein/uncharacterized repeat protein (TIGR01451 family)
MDVKKMVPLVVGLLCLVVPAASSAAAFTVNTTADGPGECATPGASCTLRGAIASASSASDPENLVAVPAGTYRLSQGELEVGGAEVTIAGAGARQTIVDGEGESRVFRANAESTVLEGLTVSGGAATEVLGEELAGDGGGILLGTSAGGATLRNVTVTGNTAMLNGGGVAAPPESGSTTGKELVVEGSTISGNKVTGGAVEALGGGIYVFGELTMTNSTVAANTAESMAGVQEGGGVMVGPAPTEAATTSTAILNSTIAGNSVGTGGVGAGLTIDNPGGMTESTSTLTNTIIAGNKVGEAESNCGPLTITSKNDLSGDGSCMFADAGSKTSTDPKLGPLADNGGETDTLALLAGSPAIDAGTAEGCPAIDQRGVARPTGTACDVGAYEYQPTAPAPSPTAMPTAPGTTQGEAADLKLTIKPQPKKPKRGKKLLFKVTVSNAGPSVASGVVFTATVPKATKKVKVKGLGAKACKLAKVKKGKKKRTLSCALGDLAPGKALTFAIPVKTRKAPRKVAIAAAVTSSVPDPTPADAKAKAAVKLKG